LGGVDKPEICDAVVGAEGFYCAFLRDGFSRRRKISLLHESAGWAGGEYHEIVLHEKIVYSMYFADSKGNKVEPAHYGIEHEAIDGAHDVVVFEDFGNGQTKLTLIGNETMEDAKNSGQVEGWIQILDKVAAVIAGLAQAK
jgi:uncharacterized protein YndB with AHSA1/START domain